MPYFHMWSFNRGRLVPHQPQANKSTNHTELHIKIFMVTIWLIIKSEMKWA